MKNNLTHVVLPLVCFVFLAAACSKPKSAENLIPVNNTSSPATVNTNPSPYDVLNLGSIWKLSVPVDANGGNTGAATTISNTKLKNGYTSEYFYTIDSPYNNVVRLWCPVNGATTSPGSGSDHPRTELIEYPLLWYTQDQSGISGETIGGRLDAQVAVKQFSSTGDIIIGQIHGGGTIASSYPFVMLHARHDTVIVYVKGDTVGNAGTVKNVLLKNVALGAKITFSITDSTNNKLYFKASAPGATGTGQWNTDVPANWRHVQVRFSAGNYLQDHDPNAPDSQGSKVNVYSLKITH
ncbi:polysaccharide lyase family 7 protein [Pedobacter sp. BS3]|uniref:polysaccharide lyase family 7 protein n=1 Tax=Pedobacter sp. BS3 TaxID=2567937 RepID=UPI0011EECD03|nr:polysaccharide lyase family 7 protein [Pedobacter sp. BS3]TZF82655.1 polysaccharide lyase family 7 protein [Pedobacter sp. BS3]